ncbi:MAG: AAA family ATPase [Syntrophobacterales bacterium]|jgi:predicted ATP-binding protein involved in virulence|nr:AAA family ATPase [Syntrophobacterales bacterium]
MKVKSLSIKNFRGIRQMDLEFLAGVNVLVGENGAGKSSILDVLAILLSRLIGRIQSSKGTGRFFSENDIKIGATETVDSIMVDFMGKSIEWQVSKARKGRKKQTITNLAGIKAIVSEVHSLVEMSEDTSLPLAVLYSVNRAVLDIPLKIRKRHQFSQLAAYDRALSSKKIEGRNDFRTFFEWFRDREDLENENARYRNALIRPPGWEFPDRQLNAIRKAIGFLMPGYKSLKVRRLPLRMTLEKNGKELRIDQLSDGEKCLLALVGDMARRLAIANPSSEDPLKATGVILIDEIDLHLHPAWQRIVIPRLTKTFPNCQFIVSTHSPQVISHTESENVFLLKEVEDNIEWRKPEVSYGQESCRILEDLMGVPARPEEIKEKLHKLFVAIDEGDLKKARKMLMNLNEILGIDPELKKAEVLINRKERIGK